MLGANNDVYDPCLILSLERASFPKKLFGKLFRLIPQAFLDRPLWACLPFRSSFVRLFAAVAAAQSAVVAVAFLISQLVIARFVAPEMSLID